VPRLREAVLSQLGGGPPPCRPARRCVRRRIACGHLKQERPSDRRRADLRGCGNARAPSSTSRDGAFVCQVHGGRDIAEEAQIRRHYGRGDCGRGDFFFRRRRATATRLDRGHRASGVSGRTDGDVRGLYARAAIGPASRRINHDNDDPPREVDPTNNTTIQRHRGGYGFQSVSAGKDETLRVSKAKSWRSGGYHPFVTVLRPTRALLERTGGREPLR